MGDLTTELAALDSSSPQYASRFVDRLLTAARDIGASDVHLQPSAEGLWVRWRIDGVLQSLGTFSRGQAADIVTRLKVLADLLTYRNDTPQEGRILATDQPPADETGASRSSMEMRVSTFPTIHGERAVVRLFAAGSQLEQLDELGLPPDVAQQLTQLLNETSGALLVTGPAGSGKTTTCYACLRHLIREHGGQKSIVSIEDPVEVAVPGVAQSQVSAAAGFDLAAGLRSLVRQDPEVLMISEIRDPLAAALATGASLTGHLVIGSFHAFSAAGAISRLADMGVEPYLLRSGVLGILSQRLMRRLCRCATGCEDESEKLDLPVDTARLPAGCDDCHQTGYAGRVVIAELLVPDRGDMGRAILSRSDAAQLEQLAIESGMITRWQRACTAVEAGDTSPAEVRRVLGLGSQ